MSIDDFVRRPIETLPPDASCVAAAALMRDRGIGSVVVAEGDVPLGIVTDRDLAIRVVAEQRDAATVTLREIMSSHPVFLSRDCSLDDVMRTMREMGVRRLPIVDRQGHLDGIVSMDDVLVALSRQLGRMGEAVAVELGPSA